MATPWRRRRAWGAVVAALALAAVAVAGFARRVVFDLEAERTPGGSPGEAAQVRVYPGSPWTSLPRLLPDSEP